MISAGGRLKHARCAVALIAAGCAGPQSALAPAGRGAEQLADLFWWMTAGAIAVWAAVVALTWRAIRARRDAPAERRATTLIIGGGVAVPTLILAALLAYGLSMLPPLLAPAPPGSLRIEVVGEQWWWRVRYHPPEGEPFDLANEIRLPVGAPVQFELTAPDVIHSFWIPALGGKIDMIPGRRNRLTLEPTRVGTFRGVCAEYCGTAHARMAFVVVVTEPAAFEGWLAAQRAAAAEPATADAARGRDRFFANGCAACHAVRGTGARGGVGPDLTHVGSRASIGAGTVANDPAGFARWLAATGEVKPGVLMPHYGMLPPDEIDALAAYLESLQ
ncbi:MAG TPA: cytochrome c oxidase subunit II [Opitutaceae bacterium]|nr:cytochrome c oxidase subunit II [Opitutaceae bacterium]